MPKKETSELVNTSTWELYEKGVKFNIERGLYKQSEINYNFFYGRQWEELESGDEHPIVINIIKPMVKHVAGIINQSNIAIVYNLFNTNKIADDMKQIYEQALKVLNEKAKKTIECNKLHTINKRRIVKHGTIDAECLLYSYWDKSTNEIVAEIIKKTNIIYGNENDDNIQKQPYMIVPQRMDYDQALKLADEMIKKGKMDASDKVFIVPDEVGLSEKDNNYGKYEVNKKVTLLNHFYRKSDGNIYIKKATKTVENFMKETSLKTSIYPIEHYLFEDVVDSARGIGLVEPNVNNQIEINRTAMRRMITIRLSAYPRLMYAKGRIVNVGALADIGKPIEVDAKDLTQGIKNTIDYLTPAQTNTDASNFERELIDDTRNLENAGEASTGQIDPEKASGRAILAVQRAATVALTEQEDRFKAFWESVGKIWFSIWKVNALDGLTVELEEEQGLNVIKKIATVTPEILENIEVEANVDVTPKSPYDKITVDMTMIDLFTSGKINMKNWHYLLIMIVQFLKKSCKR
jgi:hypothetical protein